MDRSGAHGGGGGAPNAAAGRGASSQARSRASRHTAVARESDRMARVSGSSSVGPRSAARSRVSGGSRRSGTWSRQSDDPDAPLPGDVEEFVAGFGGLLVRESDIVGEHSRMWTTYKSSFIGGSLVDFLEQRGYCDGRLAATELCNTLMEYGVFRPVSGATYVAPALCAGQCRWQCVHSGVSGCARAAGVSYWVQCGALRECVGGRMVVVCTPLAGLPGAISFHNTG